jgi:hypothetical protein
MLFQLIFRYLTGHRNKHKHTERLVMLEMNTMW